MDHLYLTQDRIGTPTGGGKVTFNEYRALERLSGRCFPLDSHQVGLMADPFANDLRFAEMVERATDIKEPGIAHIYSGCFTKTVEILKKRGFTVTYTAAAHDIAESRREFEELGIPFSFPHLVDPMLWDRYVHGYRRADAVICPSQKSAKLMRYYGCDRVEVIPHGCDLPARPPAPFPDRFTLGYLGQGGPDKGIRYLLQAWKELDLQDATLLVAGDNVSMVTSLWRAFGGGQVEVMGFVKDIGDFFSRVSVYCQPSVSEGFGIEVLEAMAHGRPVIASLGAGAADVVREDFGRVFQPRDVRELARRIHAYARAPGEELAYDAGRARLAAQEYDWVKIRGAYEALWKSLRPEFA